jgi:uncharacterized protein involved in exopolysaccharide biosynthesis
VNATEEAWDDDTLDIRELVRHLWKDKWRIVVLAIIGAAIAAAFAFTMTPVYRATAVMVSASADRTGLSGMLSSALGSIGNLASLTGTNFGSNEAAVEEALAVLRSRNFTEAFISQHNLLPELYPSDWDAESGKWTVSKAKQPTLAKAYKRFSEDVCSISRDKKTGLITVSIDWPNRERGANLVNDMVTRINAEMRARAMAQSDASLQYLNQELASTGIVDTREAINRLIEAQIRQRMIASVTQEYAFRVVDRAMTPDLTDKVRPKRAIMLILGFAFGGFIGCVWAYFRMPQGSRRPQGAVA